MVLGVTMKTKCRWPSISRRRANWPLWRLYAVAAGRARAQADAADGSTPYGQMLRRLTARQADGLRSDAERLLATGE